MRRFRRLRQTEEMRRFVRENRVSTEDLIYPLFVEDGETPVERLTERERDDIIKK